MRKALARELPQNNSFVGSTARTLYIFPPPLLQTRFRQGGVWQLSAAPSKSLRAHNLGTKPVCAELQQATRGSHGTKKEWYSEL